MDSHLMTTPTPEIAPDLFVTKQFLALLAESESVTFLSIPERPGLNGPVTTLHGDPDDLLPQLFELNKQGCGLFWCVNMA